MGQLQYQDQGGKAFVDSKHLVAGFGRSVVKSLTAFQRTTARRMMWVGFCLLVVSGCSSSVDQRLEVSGKVIWGEEPLSQGNITLTPVTKGKATGGAIENGEFSIPASRGVMPGSYLVMIEAYLPTGRQLPNSDKPGEMFDEVKQMISSKYNRNTELRAEVTRDGENSFTFKLDKR